MFTWKIINEKYIDYLRDNFCPLSKQRTQSVEKVYCIYAN